MVFIMMILYLRLVVIKRKKINSDIRVEKQTSNSDIRVERTKRYQGKRAKGERNVMLDVRGLFVWRHCSTSKIISRISIHTSV